MITVTAIALLLVAAIVVPVLVVVVAVAGICSVPLVDGSAQVPSCESSQQSQTRVSVLRTRPSISLASVPTKLSVQSNSFLPMSFALEAAAAVDLVSSVVLASIRPFAVTQQFN